MDQALKDGDHKSLEAALEQAQSIDSTDAITDKELQTMIAEAEKMLSKSTSEEEATSPKCPHPSQPPSKEKMEQVIDADVCPAEEPLPQIETAILPTDAGNEEDAKNMAAKKDTEPETGGDPEKMDQVKDSIRSMLADMDLEK